MTSGSTRLLCTSELSCPSCPTCPSYPSCPICPAHQDNITQVWKVQSSCGKPCKDGESSICWGLLLVPANVIPQEECTKEHLPPRQTPADRVLQVARRCAQCSCQNVQPAQASDRCRTRPELGTSTEAGPSQCPPPEQLEPETSAGPPGNRP